MAKMLFIISGILIIVAAFWGWRCFGYNDLRPQTVTVGNVSLIVDRVSSPAAVARGLSGRVSLADKEGMLFVFPKPAVYRFWMKEMCFPIDIIWIGADKKVVGFSENLAPESYPEAFAPPGPVRYVLEVNAGWVRKHGIMVGADLITP